MVILLTKDGLYTLAENSPQVNFEYALRSMFMVNSNDKGESLKIDSQETHIHVQLSLEQHVSLKDFTSGRF